MILTDSAAQHQYDVPRYHEFLTYLIIYNASRLSRSARWCVHRSQWID